MVGTRSKSKKLSSLSSLTDDDDGEEQNASSDSLVAAINANGAGPSRIRADSEPSTTIEDHLTSALQGLSRLRKEISSLKKENDHLQASLDELHEAEDVSIQPKRGKRGNGVSVASLQGKIRKMQRELDNLNRAREKDRKKIKKLELKEVRNEAADLEEELQNGPSDEADEMRKLLRAFYDLMTCNSLEDNEECSVCLERMEVNKASSLPCQHIFCSDCVSKLDTSKCPSCRESFDPDAVERVPYTATQQWDQLLEVAQAWATLDRLGDSGPEDTEEEETPFIDDDDDAMSSQASEPPLSEPIPPSNQEQDAPSTPPPTTTTTMDNEPPSDDISSLPQPQTPSYSKSPHAVKRQRMQELANSRRLKRRIA